MRASEGFWFRVTFGVGLLAIVGIVVALRPTPAPPPAMAYEPVERAEAPVSLTSADGRGLKLVGVSAEAVVEGPLAMTQLHLVFENPEARTLEGRFRLALPPGAAVSRFAMKVNGQWQEGEMLEKARARRVYEDFLHRRQDPALLEQAAGNEFSARVFPIPAKGRKEIILAYSERIAGKATPYRLRLGGLPKIDSFRADVTVSGHETLAVAERSFQPRGDLTVTRGEPSTVLRAGKLALIEVVPVTTEKVEPVESALVLVDTSASRVLGFEHQLKQTQAIVTALASKERGLKLTVAGFDQVVGKVASGGADSLAEGLAQLKQRRALGASNLEGALRWAVQELKVTPRRRVILVTDGVATVESDAHDDDLKALAAVGVQRVDVVTVGGIVDLPAMTRLVTGPLPKAGVVASADLAPATVVERLRGTVRRDLTIDIDGADWVYPRRIASARAGEAILVHAEVPTDRSLAVKVGGKAVSVGRPVAVEKLLLQRSWAQARIAYWEDEARKPEADGDRIRKTIIELSQRHRVLSRFTSLLVLESARDYARYDIDRKALADIIGVRDGRLVRVDRDVFSELKVPESDVEPTDASAADGDGSVTGLARRRADRAFAPPPAASGASREEAPTGRLQAPGGAKGRGARTSGGARPEAERAAPAPDDEAKAEEAPAPRRAFAPRPSPRPRPKPSPRRPEPAGGDGFDGSGVGRAPSSSPRPVFKAEKKKVRRSREARPASRLTPPVADDVLLGAVAGCGKTLTDGARGGRLEVEVRPGPGDRPVVRVSSKLLPQKTHDCAKAAIARKLSGRDVERPWRKSVFLYGSKASFTVADPRPAIGAALKDRKDALAACYAEAGLRLDGGEFVLTAVVDGTVTADVSSLRASDTVLACLKKELASLTVPGPVQDATIREPFRYSTGTVFLGAAGSGYPKVRYDAHDGKYAAFREALDRGRRQDALARAAAWQAAEPSELLAYVALGEAMARSGDRQGAARAYGSLVDFFPDRADIRRYAGALLESLDDGPAREVALDAYRKAVEQRPDHPSSHRRLAFGHLAVGQPKAAFEALEAAFKRTYPSGRFAQVKRVLAEDLGLAAAAWIAKEPAREADILRRLAAVGGQRESEPSLRFVLTWETDANDVDFHIYDNGGSHAYYGNKELASGGRLYADVTTGFGPECFTIRGTPEERRPAYTMSVHYYRRGPMGYGLGRVQGIEHDGRGGLKVRHYPFVVMKDRATVFIGDWLGPAASKAN